ncbi:MAG: Asp23/Gls24 family envelope stress response protein [Solirubrobacteraceae bacterium]
MAEGSTEQGAAVGRQGAAGTQSSHGGTSVARQGDRAGGLQTEKGATTIADTVVTKVASIATREVGGVFELGGGAARAVGSVAQRVGIGDQRSQGVSVEVGESEAAVDLTIVVEYGESIPKLAQQIRENVTRRIEGITGLAVTEVNVAVNDLHFPGDEQPDEPSRVQ